MLSTLVAGLALLTSAFPGAGCRVEPTPYRITGYVRTEFSPWTHDGTSVYTPEAIVAASWNLPHGTLLRVEGLDPTYRVADRGRLEARHIDVAVWDRATAYAIEAWVGGKYARVCIVGEAP